MMANATDNELLLVEDNQADADLFAALLQDAGLNGQQVRHVQNITDALRELEDHSVGIVLLDLRLPDGSGVENVKSVRRVSDDIPIIVLTGIDDEELAISCIDAGAQDYLCKGEVQPVALRRAIGYAVTRLRESRSRESQIRLLVSSSPDAVVVTDTQGDIQYVNDTAIGLFGKPAAELIGHSFGYPVDHGKVSEIQVRRATDTRTAEMRVVPFEWNGKPAYLASLRDMTEKKSLEAQLMQAQKMEAIGQLAGGVAHDFNNLLTIINGYAEIMLEDKAIGELPREMVTAILDSGRRAAGLTAKLLTFGRKSVFNPTTLDINPLISDMQRMLHRLIGADIELVTSLDVLLGKVKADPSQIDQIIMNLVVNARDAMPNGGKISVETQNVELESATADLIPGRYVRLTITDTGMGMSEEVRSHIFEPFFTTKEVGKGTGLGLATVYGIVRQSGGQITVSSELGKGTIFCVYLPCVDGTAGDHSADANAVISPTGTETILLVDDEDDVRHLAQIMLEAAGYNVLVASNGQEAIELAGTSGSQIRLLLTDIVMPGMSGLQLAKGIMASHPLTRILFMSGRTRDDVMQGSDPCTQIPFLHKPFSCASLTRKVREVLDGSLEDANWMTAPRSNAA